MVLIKLLNPPSKSELGKISSQGKINQNRRVGLNQKTNIIQQCLEETKNYALTSRFF